MNEKRKYRSFLYVFFGVNYLVVFGFLGKKSQRKGRCAYIYSEKDGSSDGF